MQKKISELVDAVMKPLKFASRENFARIGSVKGLDNLMEKLCTEAGSIEDPPAVVGASFARLKEIFSGFDDYSIAAKKAVVAEALTLVNPLTALAGAASFHSYGAEKAPGTPGIGDAGAAEVRARLARLKEPVESVKGIGSRLKEVLGRKGLKTVEDLLYFLPIRYEDRTNVKRIKDLKAGATELVIATVAAAGPVRYGPRRVYEVVVDDGSGLLKLKWFNFRASYMARYKQGLRFSIYGAVSAWGHQPEMIHPDMELLGDDNDATASAEADASAEVVPVYSQIENLHQKTIRKIVGSAVAAYGGSLVGGPGEDILKRHGLIALPEAIRKAHHPMAMAMAAGPDGALARRSLVFDELFTLEVGLALKRSACKLERGVRFSSVAGDGPSGGGLEERFRDTLEFKLTGAQERVLSEIRRDMAAPHPMNRLIQGDVGSGKTVVSLLASLWAIESGFQAAIMAPTEILAEQHYLSTHKYIEALGLKSILLRGRMPVRDRKRALGAIKAGEVDLVIGTHALIQDDVAFKALALVVVDEQHRFGVVQRAILKKKGVSTSAGGATLIPDTLIMTATPIPRTMRMTVFGDLDVSVIDEMPPGRQPVKTRILRECDRAKAYKIITDELRAGAQAYVVYPLVEESEELPLKDATRMKEHLEADIFADFNVGLLHGRMKSPEKEAVMRAFKDRSIDLLVSTTVIEVGVDVPNATVMFVEHAERFGMAQLHQLRGRVGRGPRASVCLLLAQWTGSVDTLKRLRVLERCSDGFRIAEEDLKLRGAGDFIGTRQAGFPDFRMAGILGDPALVQKARDEAFAFVEDNPGLAGAQAARVREVLQQRWEGRLELAEIG
jgi:ATP-dependent DNA helicase RecG